MLTPHKFNSFLNKKSAIGLMLVSRNWNLPRPQLSHPRLPCLPHLPVPATTEAVPATPATTEAVPAVPATTDEPDIMDARMPDDTLPDAVLP